MLNCVKDSLHISKKVYEIIPKSSLKYNLIFVYEYLLDFVDYAKINE